MFNRPFYRRKQALAPLYRLKPLLNDIKDPFRPNFPLKINNQTPLTVRFIFEQVGLRGITEGNSYFEQFT